METQKVNFLKYWGVFLATSYGLIIVAEVIAYLASFELPSAISVVSAMLGGAYAGSYFIRWEGREPDRRELWTLILGSFGLSIVVGVALLGLIALVSPELGTALSAVLSKLSLLTFIGIALFVTVLYGLALWLGYGSLARTMARHMKK